MKIMISQPMRGKTEEEIRKDRELAIECIKEMDYEHIESIMNKIPSGAKNEKLWCLGASYERMSFAEGVLFIGNWKNYRGCKLEYLACRSYGVKTYKLIKDCHFDTGWKIVEFQLKGKDFLRFMEDASSWEAR